MQGVDLKPSFKWTDRHSPYALDNPRAMAEDELLSLRHNTFVLNLSGLWVRPSFSYRRHFPLTAVIREENETRSTGSLE